jgi:hypothetical protein
MTGWEQNSIARNLRTSSTGCRRLPALLLLLAVVVCIGAGALHAEAPAAPGTEGIAPGDPWKLIDGVLVVYTRGGAVRLPSDGRVLSAAGGEDGLYYMRAAGGSPAEGPVYACMLAFNGGALVEKHVYDGAEGTRIMRLAGYAGTLYVLAGKGENGPGTLYRVSMNSGESSTVSGVLDFCISGGKAVLLEAAEDRACVNSNGARLCLTLGGGASIRQLVADRILFVSWAGETEVVDLVLMRSLYRFSDTVRYLKPDEWNLLIEAVDVYPGASEWNMVFYKVFVDDVEAGRTDTGNPSVARSMQLDLDPDCMHVVRMERWELNSARGRYERANNIRQPAPLKLFVPGWMVMKLNATFNGKVYSSRTEILTEQ